MDGQFVTGDRKSIRHFDYARKALRFLPLLIAKFLLQYLQHIN